MAKNSEQEAPRVKIDPKVEPYDSLSNAAKLNRLRDACRLLVEQTGLSDILPKDYL